MKKAIIFSRGYSNDINTWSNVPYFLCSEIEKEYQLVRVNIKLEDKNIFYKLLSKSFNFFSRKISPIHAFERTRFYEKRVNKIIKKTYDANQDAAFAMCFDFSTDLSNEYGIKKVLLSDWTIEYYIKHQLNREPNKTERRLIKNQNSLIKTADYKITLFPNVELENKELGLKHLLFPSNSEVKFEINPEVKYHSNRILFVGRKHYKNALRELIEAVELINNELGENRYLLDIIGMDSKAMKKVPEFCRFHGYLNKHDPTQMEIYRDCFQNAKVAVYSSANWVGASSLLECLISGIPVVLKPNPDAKILFAHEGVFFIDDCSKNGIKEAVININKLDLDSYSNMVNSLSKDYSNNTWNKFFELMKKYCNI